VGLANDAVSSLNGKVEGISGNRNGETANALAGSVSAPLGDAFGIQADGLGGEINPDDAHGFGLHTFWRDSTIGLLGLTASNVELGTTEATRYGVEGEYYLDRATLTGYIGHQAGDIDDSMYGRISASCYLLDDLVLLGYISTSDDLERYALEAEYQTPVNGVSCYASIATGENDYDHAYFGLKIYMGTRNKTLIRRHREDDPLNNVWHTVLDLFMIPSLSSSSGVRGGGGSGGG